MNREARMGRTALVIHPTLKERSLSLAEPASDIKMCEHYQNFPLYLGGDAQEHYGIPHGFSLTYGAGTFSEGIIWRAIALSGSRFLPVTRHQALA